MYFYNINNQITLSATLLTEGEELTSNTTDSAYEKHVPQIEQHGDHVTVMVGSVPIPCWTSNYIEWIILETVSGFKKKDLKLGDKPEADFVVTGPILTAWEYCNLQSLWKAEA